MALFRGAGVGGFRAEHILVSRSTAGLRGLLREQVQTHNVSVRPHETLTCRHWVSMLLTRSSRGTQCSVCMEGRSRFVSATACAIRRRIPPQLIKTSHDCPGHVSILVTGRGVRHAAAAGARGCAGGGRGAGRPAPCGRARQGVSPEPCIPRNSAAVRSSASSCGSPTQDAYSCHHQAWPTGRVETACCITIIMPFECMRSISPVCNTSRSFGSPRSPILHLPVCRYQLFFPDRRRSRRTQRQLQTTRRARCWSSRAARRCRNPAGRRRVPIMADVTVIASLQEAR